ncbi:DUF4177 domain-containing protein [Colwelliaceae bacterium 6471]
MKIDIDTVVKLRKERLWSQDELSIAAGLNLRTIQRIENEGAISLQSKKALASAFEIEISKLDPQENKKQFEYQTVPIKFTFGWFKKGTAKVDEVLSEHGKQGWRLVQMIMPTDATGGSEQMIAIMEREI